MLLLRFQVWVFINSEPGHQKPRRKVPFVCCKDDLYHGYFFWNGEYGLLSGGEHANARSEFTENRTGRLSGLYCASGHLPADVHTDLFRRLIWLRQAYINAAAHRIGRSNLNCELVPQTHGMTTTFSH